MKDGVRTGEQQVEVSRQDLYGDYIDGHLRLCSAVGPCRDPALLRRAARYLLREPQEPRGPFTVFPFQQALREGCGASDTDGRELLSAFIKATEMLETVCVNLFLQPWKKEIKTLKTFTGPFVYCLLPVLSSSTIQSVLASIGYLPHSDTPPSEYRLSEAADPDTAMQVGFELLLARVECSHLLELAEKDQLGRQELLEMIQKRVGHAKPQEEPTEKTERGQKEEKDEEQQQEEEEEKKKKKKEETESKEMHLDSRFEVNPKPKPRRTFDSRMDPSIMEMQMAYPDLAFRGRPLLPDKPSQNTSRSNRKALHTAGANNDNNDSKTAELTARDGLQETKAAAPTVRSKASEAFGESGRSRGYNDRNSGQTTGDTSSVRDTQELSHSQSASLHITLRAGSTSEPGQLREESSVWTLNQTAADPQNRRPASPGPPSLTSTDEEQDLRELAERMGQPPVQGTKEEARRKDENKRGHENTNKERGEKERKASAEGEAEEQNHWPPGPAGGHAAHRHSRSSQSEPTGRRKPRLVLSDRAADCQGCAGGRSGQQEGEDTERGREEEEQQAQTYIIL